MRLSTFVDQTIKPKLPGSFMSKNSNPSEIVKPGRPLWMKIVIAGGILCSLGLLLYFLTEPIARPKTVSVSNVSSESITLSWTTDLPTPTKVLLSEAGISQYLPFFYYASTGDDRDSKEEVESKRNVHYVTLQNLKPNTRYVARIYIGVRQVFEQKLTTGLELALSEPDLVYGKIMESKDVPANGTLVYLRLINRNGLASALMSALTSEKGSWSIETSNARTRNLSKSFDQAGIGYELMVVDNGKGKRFKATTQPGKDRPWPNVVLEASASGGIKK